MKMKGDTMQYLFDFDGTLVDSMGVFGGAMLNILDEYNIPYGEDVLKIITPLGYGGTADYFLSLGIEATKEELMAQMMNEMRDAYLHRITAKEGVTETLRALHARGDSLNILTASPHEVLDPCLKRNGIYHLFEHVWSCDDFFTTKANPEIYRMAAEKMGVTVAEVIFLDDNVNACKTALSAGMRVVGVYDESSADMAEEMMRVTHGYVRDLTALLGMNSN